MDQQHPLTPHEQSPQAPLTIREASSYSITGDIVPGLVTTLDLSDQTVKIDLYNALQLGGDIPAEHVNTEFEVAGFTVFPQTYHSGAEGEPVRANCLIITTAKGDHIRFASDGILRSVSELVALLGEPPYEGMRFRLVRRIFGEGHGSYRLQAVRPAAAKSKS